MAESTVLSSPTRESLVAKIKLTTLILVTAIVVVVAWGWQQLTGYRSHNMTLHGYLLSLPDRSRVKVRLNGRNLTLEIVNTQDSITQGLSDRSEIGSDGMLFVMPTKGHHSFWMPRMHFDLDILWFEDETLFEITRSVPAPAANQPYSTLPLYTSRRPANLILEIPAGRAKMLGFAEEQTLEFLGIASTP